MNTAWLLRSSTLWWAIGLSSGLSMLILVASPEGFPALRRRQVELEQQKQELLQKRRRNLDLALEVERLARKDPELMEALCRRQGYARPGETVYTFRNRGEQRR